MVSSAKKYLIEKRWALIAIGLGTALGFASAILCIAWNLVIFGFNIMYIVSPLLAGFVETVIASKKYGRSTGAISALLTFMLINGYGWFGPGWIFPKEPVTLSLITIIAIVLTLQAAFPTLINYILFVGVVGTLTKLTGFLIRKPSQISAMLPENLEQQGITSQTDDIFLEELNIPLLTVHPLNGDKIDKYMGMVAGEAVAEEKQAEGRVSGLLKIIEPVQLDSINLGNARKTALSRMLEEAKAMGANAVEEVLIDYVSMGGLQGSATIVTATGTAILIEDGAAKTPEKESGEKLMGAIDDTDVSQIDGDDSGEKTSAPESHEKIKEKSDKKGDKISSKELSQRIEQYIHEKNHPSTLERETLVKNKFKDIGDRYNHISNELAQFEEKFAEYDAKYDAYINKKIHKIYGNVKMTRHADYKENRNVRIKEGIIGKEVLDVNLRVMGKVKEVRVNSHNQVESIIIGGGGILERFGLSKNDITIPFNRVSSLGDRILLKK